MLIRFYKPYGVLSQFTDAEGRATLAHYIDQPRVFPAGRLDFDSEGLMLLTDEGALQARIAEPRHKLPKTYLAQVEARPDAETFARLAERLVAGVELRDGIARAVSIRQVEPPLLPERQPPVTPHRAARSSWVEVVLTEGRNRQVRRMLAAVGLPVLRLLRTRMGPIDLRGLAPGEWEAIDVPEELRGTLAPGRVRKTIPKPRAQSATRPRRPSGRRPPSG